ncbi:hypothetical protein N8586_04830, partial [Verrucomicrobiales bacterium]|nr:hypothetical protein [Verrucomicrobiales bacterium]
MAKIAGSHSRLERRLLRRLRYFDDRLKLTEAQTAKLDTLKSDHAANPRLRKACYWLHVAQVDGMPPASVVDATGHATSPRGQLAKESLLRNLTILERLGCFTPDNLAKLRRGRAPIITRRPYASEIAEVDHIVPVAVAPAFSNWIGNL